MISTSWRSLAKAPSRSWLLPLIGALYLIPFPYFPAIHSPNEGSRLYQVRALVDDGTFAVNGALQRYGPVGDLARSQGGLYPNKAPGVSILGALVYAVAKALVGWRADRISNEVLLYLLRVSCSGLPTLALLWFLRPLLGRWSGDGESADVILFTYALGSLAYTYGLLFFSHQLAAVCLAGALLALEASRTRERLWLLGLGGFLAGYAVLTEYTAALAALPLGLYVLWTARQKLAGAVAFGAASLPPQALLLWYHKIAYGSPFRIGYQNNVNQTFQGWHNQGFMGVTTPSLLALGGSFFSPAKGLLIFSPFLALGLLGLWILKDRPATRPPAALLGALFLLYSAFTASFIYEAWGWTVGPRHLAPLAAFLALPAAVGLAAARRRGDLAGGVACGLCLLSVLLTSLATITYPHFPEDFSNGFFEVTVPLLLGGYLPRNAIGLLGGAPALGWFLYFGCWLAGLITIVRLGARGVGRAAAVGTAAAGLLCLGVLARGHSVQKASMLRFIEETYRAAQ